MKTNTNGMRRNPSAVDIFKKRSQQMQAMPPVGPAQAQPMGLNRQVAAPPLKYGAP